MKYFNPRTVLLAAVCLLNLSAFAQKGETVKIAWIDPLTGLMAPVGSNGLKSFKFVAEEFNKSNVAGVKFEVIGMDNKLSPAESVNDVTASVDQGIHYVVQGNGSAVAGAIIESVNKNNERNPGKEVLFLNYAAVDPDFTNSKCSYWHFRFDADTSMKIEALTTFMKDQKDIKKVFLLNQDYSHGHQVAKYAKDNLAIKRPDIQIVGEDYHPLAKVRDFTPYIAKIKASGADSVITGNWGSDLALLIKAANEGGFTGKFYTYYVSTTGTPTAIGTSGEGKIFQVSNGHYNMGGKMQSMMAEYKKRSGDDLYIPAIAHIFNALTLAMSKAQSTNPVKVAAQLHGLHFDSVNGALEMRRLDHQLQQPLYITVWQKADKKSPYSPENTGMTLAVVKSFESYVSSTPTTCDMKTP
jgi:branched-chain amino acid transport system substrate-binding protein